MHPCGTFKKSGFQYVLFRLFYNGINVQKRTYVHLILCLKYS